MSGLLDKARTSASSLSQSNLNVDEERSYYIGRTAVQGVQLGSLAATPLFAVQALRKGGLLNLRGLARANWTVPLAGGVLGAGAGLITASQADNATITSKSLKLRADANRVRRDDLHLIGGTLGALILPAIFLRRVGLINGALGGVGLGGAVGLITHTVQTYSAEDISKEAHRAVDNAEQKAKELTR